MKEDLHEAHHRWIEEQIQRDKWKTLFWQKMALHVAKWGSVSLLSAIGYAAYLGAQEWLRRHIL